MSIFTNNTFAVNSYTFEDFFEGGYWNQGLGLTFNQALAGDYPCVGEWFNIAFPTGQIIVGQGYNYQPTVPSDNVSWIYQTDKNYFGTKNTGTEIIVESNYLILESIRKLRTLKYLKLGYSSVGNIVPKVEICIKDNFNDTETWYECKHFVDKNNHNSYLLRDMGAHVYFKFRITWTNTSDDYIKSLNVISLTVDTDGEITR